MARKARKSSLDATPRASSKRPQPDAEVTSASKRPRRQASTATLKSTPTKSKYFEGTSESGFESSEASADEELSAFEDEDGDAEVSSAQESESDVEMTDEDETPRKAKTKLKQSPASRRKQSAAKMAMKEGAKTGYGPGTQVIIKKPKARPAGSTPYKDDTIHPNTLLFLKDLKANNNRPWLKGEGTTRVTYCLSPCSYRPYLQCIADYRQ